MIVISYNKKGNTVNATTSLLPNDRIILSARNSTITVGRNNFDLFWIDRTSEEIADFISEENDFKALAHVLSRSSGYKKLRQPTKEEEKNLIGRLVYIINCIERDSCQLMPNDKILFNEEKKLLIVKRGNRQMWQKKMPFIKSNDVFFSIAKLMTYAAGHSFCKPPIKEIKKMKEKGFWFFYVDFAE